MDPDAPSSDAEVVPVPVPVERARPAEDARGPAATAETRPSAGRRPLHWLFEGIFIVVSVVLGFSLAEFGEYRNERQLAARVVASIRAELEYNQATLQPFLPIHRAWRDALARTEPTSGTRSAIDVLFATRPYLPPDIRSNVPLLRRAAWDTALSTGALRLIDYDLAAGLSEVYFMQDHARAAFSALFADSSFFDPASQSGAIRLAQTNMQELVWSEEMLTGLYDRHLPTLRASVDGQ